MHFYGNGGKVIAFKVGGTRWRTCVWKSDNQRDWMWKDAWGWKHKPGLTKGFADPWPSVSELKILGNEIFTWRSSPFRPESVCSCTEHSWWISHTLRNMRWQHTVRIKKEWDGKLYHFSIKHIKQRQNFCIFWPTLLCQYLQGEMHQILVASHESYTVMCLLFHWIKWALWLDNKVTNVGYTSTYILFISSAL